MAKAEWGQKRQCPKCAVRFYDLGNEPPLTCVSCGVVFTPEPILKPRNPVAAQEAAPKSAKEAKPKHNIEGEAEIEEEEDILLGDDDEDEESDINIDDDDVMSYEEADDEVAGTIKIKPSKDED